MDSDVQRELEERLRDLNSAISGLNGSLNSLSQPTTNAKNQINKNTSETDKNVKNLQENTTASDKLSEATSAAAEAKDRFNQSMKKTFLNLVDSLESFGKAALTNEQGFKKYGNTVDLVGKSAFELGSNFGVLGTVLGGLTFAFAKATKAGLEQADNLLKGVDTLSQLGAGGEVTTNKLYSMAHSLGLTTKNLDIFTKAVDKNSTSIIALGKNSGDSIKNLASMLKVTPNQRMAFQRLGVSQEELMDRMTDYVDLQVQTGNVISDNDIKTGKATQAMLEYAANITVVSKITGKNADQARKSMMEAKAKSNIELHTARLTARFNDPNTAQDEKDRIEKQLAIEDQLLNAAQQTNSPEVLAAMQSALATGSVTQESAILAKMGIDPKKIVADQQKRTLTEIKDERGYGQARVQFLNQLRTGVKTGLRDQAQAAEFNEKYARSIGLGPELVQNMTKNMTTDFEQQNQEIRQQLKDNENGTGAVAEDPAQQARNKMTQLQIDAGQVVDDAIKAVNPLLGNSGKFALLATGAGVATVALTALSLKMKSSLFGGGGNNVAKGARTAKNLEEAAVGSAETGIINEAEGGLIKAAPKPKGFGDSLRTIAGSLSKAGAEAPVVMLGAGALAVAITELAAGTALSVFLMGGSLKVFGEGMQSFSKIDGKNLALVGIGMSGLTTGVIAMGAAAPIHAFNALMKLAGQDPLESTADMLINLQKRNFDSKKIENNGKAIVSYALAMTAISALGAVGNYADIIKKMYGGISKTLSSKPPYEEFAAFSRLPVADPKKVKTNADAFVEFSKALSQYKGGSELVNVVSAIAGANLNSLFGVDGPIDAFKKFAAMDINPKAADNAQAFFNFASGMGILSGINNGLLGELTKGAVKGTIQETAKLVGGLANSVGSAISGTLGNIGAGIGGALQSVQTMIGGTAGKILGLIASKEAKTYDTVLGGGRNPELLNMTIGQAYQWGQNFRKTNPIGIKYNSSAIGKYQMVGGTLLAWANKAGLDPQKDKFSPENQDKMVLAGSGIGDKINDLASGKLSAEQLTHMIATTWQSWPLSPNNNAIGGAKATIPWATAVQSINDAIHKAAKGGAFSGPDSGYLVELHGTEMVIPVEADSTLMKLSTMPDSVIAELEKNREASKPYTTSNNSSNSGGKITRKMIASLASEFDQVINTIEKNDRVGKKILQYSKI